jgi:hypothetical protein
VGGCNSHRLVCEPKTFQVKCTLAVGPTTRRNARGNTLADGLGNVCFRRVRSLISGSARILGTDFHLRHAAETASLRDARNTRLGPRERHWRIPDVQSDISSATWVLLRSPRRNTENSYGDIELLPHIADEIVANSSLANTLDEATDAHAEAARIRDEGRVARFHEREAV